MKERKDIPKENEDNAIKSKQKEVDESASRKKKNGGFLIERRKQRRKYKEVKRKNKNEK